MNTGTRIHASLMFVLPLVILASLEPALAQKPAQPAGSEVSKASKCFYRMDKLVIRPEGSLKDQVKDVRFFVNIGPYQKQRQVDASQKTSDGSYTIRLDTQNHHYIEKDRIRHQLDATALKTESGFMTRTKHKAVSTYRFDQWIPIPKDRLKHPLPKFEHASGNAEMKFQAHFTRVCQ